MFGCPAGELLSRISSAELTEWIAELRLRDQERRDAEDESSKAAETKGVRK